MDRSWVWNETIYPEGVGRLVGHSSAWQRRHQHTECCLERAPYASGSDLKRRGTNPPELIAAAHAGSFSMTLANELGEAGFRPRQIDTTVTITMENVAALWTMTQIHLDVTATVPKVAQ